MTNTEFVNAIKAKVPSVNSDQINQVIVAMKDVIIDQCRDKKKRIEFGTMGWFSRKYNGVKRKKQADGSIQIINAVAAVTFIPAPSIRQSLVYVPKPPKTSEQTQQQAPLADGGEAEDVGDPVES